MHFPTSGVDCSPFLPPLVAFVVSALTASAGVSGAFLLLPFQVSVLGFAGPAVSPTNLIFNILATPGAIRRYAKERRLVWPIAWVLIAGTLPGVAAGAAIRVRYLPDARSFKAFAGCVLLYLGARLLYDAARRAPIRVPRLAGEAAVKTLVISAARIEYTFCGQTFVVRPVALGALSLIVGLVGGIYGIGGGAIIAPFLVSMLGLPVYTVAGATLTATLATSVVGIAAFEWIGSTGAAHVRPDWALGLLFGVGGLAGAYIGARMQRFLPEQWIRLLLGLLVGGLALAYIVQFFA
jgi:uncharacterized membrane protein YfcA